MSATSTRSSAQPVLVEEVPAPALPRQGARRQRRRRSLRQLLLEEPQRFTFDAAVAVMMRASSQAAPADAVRFRARLGLGFVASDFDAIQADGARFVATTGLLGLTGAGGVLPRPYTEIVNSEHRHRSTALAAFLDVLAQRPLAQFAQAGIKYRPHRSADAESLAVRAGEASPRADGMRRMLRALTGHLTLAPDTRPPLGPDPLLYYAGTFASRPRTAERLGSLLADWLGLPVVVEQFAGSWLRLNAEEQSRLPGGGGRGRHHRLGIDAAIGRNAWNIQSRITLRVGPVDADAFARLMPGCSDHASLVGLARAYLDGDVGFILNPVLKAAHVPEVALGDATPNRARLGWNTWLPTHGGRRQDAREAVFAASGGDPVHEARSTA